MEYRLESFIQQYLAYVQENYPGVVYCWDVVNEAVEPSELMGIRIVSSTAEPNMEMTYRTYGMK